LRGRASLDGATRVPFRQPMSRRCCACALSIEFALRHQFPLVNHPLARCFARRELLADEVRYRQELALRYSYVVPESRLLGVLRRHSPLVELGAGTGYWAYLLRLMGTDVIAYDHAPFGSGRNNRYHVDFRRWTDVIEGDTEAILRHSDRTLFLCWPPKFSALWKSVDLYRGDCVIYIGDGGTRTPAIRALQEGFILVETHPAIAMEPAPGTEVKLSVWRRRGHFGKAA